LAQHRQIFIKLAFFLLFLPFASASQVLPGTEIRLGINLGLNLAFGSHFQRLGLNFHMYVISRSFQSNSEIRAYVNFKSLGPKFSYPELVLSQGIVFAYGPGRDFLNPFISSISNQTSYSNSIAYSYNAYFNNRKTTQQTGIIAIEYNNVFVITENDLLARPMLDRFRTAALLVQYQYKDIFQAAINCTMWTGQMGKRVSIANNKIASGCYLDSTGGVYTNTSHGLLSAQVKYNPGYSQNVQLNCGIDAEQVRNAVQNKFMHDMPLIPRKWNKSKNCHIPMLDENGDPYLYGADQKIRKARLYLNAFTNANLFY
jgi:hypothetical protein